MGLWDSVGEILEGIGGRSGSQVRMITDVRVVITIIVLVFLALLIFIIVPGILWFMTHILHKTLVLPHLFG